MSLEATAAEIAAAINLVADMHGHQYRPSAPSIGDAWPVLGPMDRDAGDAFIVSWGVRVFVPQDDRDARRWWDEHWPAIRDALRPVAFIDRAEPISLPAAGGEQLAFQIMIRTEE